MPGSIIPIPKDAMEDIADAPTACMCTFGCIRMCCDCEPAPGTTAPVGAEGGGEYIMGRALADCAGGVCIIMGGWG